jgi:hypothetical protein
MFLASVGIPGQVKAALTLLLSSEINLNVFAPPLRMSQPTDRMSPEPYRLFEATYVDALKQMHATGFEPITMEEALVKRIQAARSADPALEGSWWDRPIGTGSSIFYFPRTEESLEHMIIAVGTAPVQRLPHYPNTMSEAVSPDPETLRTLSGHPVRLGDFIVRQNEDDAAYNHIWQLLASPDVLQDYQSEALQRTKPFSETGLMTLNIWPYSNPLMDRWSEPVMWPLILGEGAKGSHLSGAGTRVVREGTTVPIIGRRIDASKSRYTEQ